MDSRPGAIPPAKRSSGLKYTDDRRSRPAYYREKKTETIAGDSKSAQIFVIPINQLRQEATLSTTGPLNERAGV
jgi:hypothetical protein